MADPVVERDNEKYATSDDNGSAERAQPVTYERPGGLKGFYSHPVSQVVMLGLVCFMCPGLFNAINGLGAGGQVDHTTSARSNAAVYGMFAVSALFAGSINNKIGSRWTLFLGSLGYALYIGSYLAMNIHPNAGGFVIAAGVLLGISAGLLWTAQGSLMLSYATEGQKGRFISIFWTIFNLGAVIASSVNLAININNTTNSVGNSTYIAFLILTLVGSTIPLFLIEPHNIIRTDGTKVTPQRHPSWKTEFYKLWVAVRDDPLIVLLFPMFLASNWFYTWQFNGFNGILFNIQGRSLNNFVYWLSQIFGSILMGFLLDSKRISRRVRAFAGWAVLFVAVLAINIWAYFYQKNYTRATYDPALNPNPPSKLGIHDAGFAARAVLFMLFGFVDAMWQITAYWIIGAMSNDPAKLAHFVGLYKCIQSAGAAGVWGADGGNAPLMNLFLSTWILMMVGLVFALPMIYVRVKNTTDMADETLARMDDSGNIRDTSDYREK